MDALVAGLSLPERLTTLSEEDGGAVLDNRLGYRFKPPGGWSHASRTPEAVEGFGSVALWTGDSGREVLVVALCPMGGEAPSLVLANFIEESSLSALRKAMELSLDEPVPFARGRCGGQ